MNLITLIAAIALEFNVSEGFTPVNYESEPSFGTDSTITVKNADQLKPGVYELVTMNSRTYQSTGYGMPTLQLEGECSYPVKLVAEAKRIVLLVKPTEQADRTPITILPYGDSITHGYNTYNRANYRIPLYQKLEMLGYNVKAVGFWKSNYGNNYMRSYTPAGVETDMDDWLSHSGVWSARVGAVNEWSETLTENVEPTLDQAGYPDVVLMHIGTNDGTALTAQQNFDAQTNIVQRILDNRDNVKVVMSTILPLQTGHSKYFLNADRIEPTNELLREFFKNLPAAWQDKVYLADLWAYVPDTTENYVSDNTHPDWIGHDKMAEGWLSVLTNIFPNADVEFNAAKSVPASPTKFGAAEYVPAAYLKDMNLAARLDIGATTHFQKVLPTYNEFNASATNGFISKVGYFMELVRKNSNIHRYVWCDMTPWSQNFASLGLPTQATVQRRVKNLHVYSNTTAIENVEPTDNTVEGWLEFTPFNYTYERSGVTGAPYEKAFLGWDDTLTTSGGYACMQVHRLFPNYTAMRSQAQVLFAYNNWGTLNMSGNAEIGIGNFSQHATTAREGQKTEGKGSTDYTFTGKLDGIDAGAYEVMRLEIWTKLSRPSKILIK